MTKFKPGDRVIPKSEVSFLLQDYKYDKIIVSHIDDSHSFPVKCDMFFEEELIEIMSFKETELTLFSPFSKIKWLL